jgi:SMI1 / KNR4 family (SUKH-1)
MAIDKFAFVERVLERWRDHGISFLSGVDESELASLEERYGVHLPDDMRAFYRATNGTRGPQNSSGTDEQGLEFWPVEDIEPLVRHQPKILDFADYMMAEHTFGTDLDETSNNFGTVYGGGHIMARSFSEFMEMYVAGDERLIYPRLGERPNWE